MAIRWDGGIMAEAQKLCSIKWHHLSQQYAPDNTQNKEVAQIHKQKWWHKQRMHKSLAGGVRWLLLEKNSPCQVSRTNNCHACPLRALRVSQNIGSPPSPGEPCKSCQTPHTLTPSMQGGGALGGQHLCASQRPFVLQLWVVGDFLVDGMWVLLW